MAESADATAQSENVSHPSCSFSESTDEVCIICKDGINTEDSKVKLSAKGCSGINKASSQRGDDILASVDNHVHVKCRREYTNPNRIAQFLKHKSADQSPQRCIKRSLRTADSVYKPASQCLFCTKGEKWSRRGGQKVCVKFISVKTKQFQDSVFKQCSSRNDEWSKKVKARLEYMQDCFACDVVYHNVCSTNFRTEKQLPTMFADDEPAKKMIKFSAGRPEDKTCLHAFHEIISFLENNDTEQVTVRDLVQMMQDILHQPNPDSDNCIHDAYSVPYMKKKLTEHFGEHITIMEENGKADVVTLKKTASNILRAFYSQQKKTGSETESVRLIKTAAALIRSDIMAMCCDKSTYPGTLTLDPQLEFLPVTLRTLLSEIFRGKNTELKTASIGQCMIQATRPNTCIAPLQVKLAVQMHKTFGSRFLIDSLNKMGYCSSYTEVKRFHLNAAASTGLDLPEVTEGKTLQFVADNVDHNSATLDGHNTFHGMGMIAVLTPGANKARTIPRKEIDIGEVTALGKVNIHFYRSDWNGLSSVFFKDVSDITAVDETSFLDTLWKVSWPLKSPRPAWNGLMQTVHDDGVYPGKSEVFFLPMIDLSSSDVSCIYSTLMFICNQARKYGVTPVVTFDQPLFIKAQAIVNSEGPDSPVRSVILQLGNFHTQMSFLGSVGHLMNGSGLQEALELVYAPSVVPHILSGKAHSRAVRAHLLMDAALSALLTAGAYDMPWILIHHGATFTEESHGIQDEKTDLALEVEQLLPEEREHQIQSEAASHTGLELEANPEVCHEDLDAASTLIEHLLAGQTSAHEAAKHPVLDRITKKLADYRNSLSPNRTSALWLQYLEMIDILKMTIKAERFLMVVGSLTLGVMSSITEFEPMLSNYALYLEVVMLVWVATEFLIRLWSAGCRSRYQGVAGRLKFLRRPLCVIDVVLIAATVTTLIVGSTQERFATSVISGLRFFQILRMVRMDRRGGTWKLLGCVVWAHRQELVTTLYIGTLGLIFSSYFVYLAEKNAPRPQRDGEKTGAPPKFSNFADAIWWGVVTLCTVGYGDVVPTTWGGKVIASFSAVLGISFFALPAGILGSGFALKVQQQQRQKHLNRRRVPAAELIQCLWRCYAADENSMSVATWKPHLVPCPSPTAERPWKNNTSFVSRFSTRRRDRSSAHANSFKSDNPAQSPLCVRHNSRRSAISNTEEDVPNVLDRSHLSLATGIADQRHVDLLPVKKENSMSSICKESEDEPDLSPRMTQLSNREKQVIRALRKIRYFVARRKFREALRPYDVKDVIEQYSAGHVDMLGRIKNLQGRLDQILGRQGSKSKDVYESKICLASRVVKVERQVEDIESKLDLLIDLYKEDRKILLQHIQMQHQSAGGQGQPLAPPTAPMKPRPILVDKQFTSEPATPTGTGLNLNRPMHRNLSDLSQRIKKRVTYRCLSLHDPPRRNPPSTKPAGPSHPLASASEEEGGGGDPYLASQGHVAGADLDQASPPPPHHADAQHGLRPPYPLSSQHDGGRGMWGGRDAGPTVATTSEGVAWDDTGEAQHLEYFPAMRQYSPDATTEATGGGDEEEGPVAPPPLPPPPLPPPSFSADTPLVPELPSASSVFTSCLSPSDAFASVSSASSSASAAAHAQSTVIDVPSCLTGSKLSTLNERSTESFKDVTSSSSASSSPSSNRVAGGEDWGGALEEGGGAGGGDSCNGSPPRPPSPPLLLPLPPPPQSLLLPLPPPPPPATSTTTTTAADHHHHQQHQQQHSGGSSSSDTAAAAGDRGVNSGLSGSRTDVTAVPALESLTDFHVGCDVSKLKTTC